MPNWTDNTFTVEGDEAVIQKLIDERCTDGALDFDKIIPKPEGFNEHLSSGSGDEAYDLYYFDNAWKKYLGYPWVVEAGGVDRDSVIAVMAARYKPSEGQPATYKDLADAYKRNVDLTGFKNWYEWNIANWGTKWSACHPQPVERRDGVAEFRFSTAWCEPLPIFEALHEQYPSLEMEYIARRN